ncbi:MAG: efflux RND transporter periplasmic adaptor subunit [Mariniphaga sp.]
MKKKNNTVLYLVILGVIVIVGLIAGKKAGWFGKDMALKVAVEKVQKKDITEIITANGKIEPQMLVKISPEVPGEIIELPVKEGDEVKKGDLLVVIRPDIYISNRNRLEASLNSQKARQAQAEAQLVEKELNYKRSKQLFDKNTIARSDFETIEASWKVAQSEVQAARFAVKSAESSLNESQENLTKTKIYSPISGTVSKLNVEKGEKVVGTNQFAGTELMTIADLTLMEVKVEVNENDIVNVEKSDTANIKIDAYMKRKFNGLVTEIASSANVLGTSTDQVTNFNVKILLLQASYADLLVSNPHRYPFLPGMSATVEIRTDTRKGVITIPIQAVTTRADNGAAKKSTTQPVAEVEGKDTNEEKIASKDPEQFEVVFVNRNGLARQVKVKTGIQDNTNIQIIEGLNPDDQIIVAPYGLISKTLKDSTLIEIVKLDDLYKVKK